MYQSLYNNNIIHCSLYFLASFPFSVKIIFLLIIFWSVFCILSSFICYFCNYYLLFLIFFLFLILSFCSLLNIFILFFSFLFPQFCNLLFISLFFLLITHSVVPSYSLFSICLCRFFSIILLSLHTVATMSHTLSLVSFEWFTSLDLFNDGNWQVKTNLHHQHIYFMTVLFVFYHFVGYLKF